MRVKVEVWDSGSKRSSVHERLQALIQGLHVRGDDPPGLSLYRKEGARRLTRIGLCTAWQLPGSWKLTHGEDRWVLAGNTERAFPAAKIFTFKHLVVNL